jgi:hypothetical protein
MVHTTPPMEDKAGTSSAEAPMTRALVVRLESKVPHDTLAGNNLHLLNFAMVEPEIVCQMSSRLENC